MTLDITPHEPRGPLRWSDAVLDMQDLLADIGIAAYIVGGAVRDAMLGAPIQDIDIATAGSGMQLARIIANRLGGAYYPLDKDRDVGRALLDTMDGRLEIDVARFRGEDLAADLLDRDFTINAMAVDLRAVDRLIDPLNGEQDLIDKVVRRCGPASIADDPIRALRAVRQSAQFRLRIEPTTLQDVRSHAARLPETSPERVRDEFFKLLRVPNVGGALRVAHRLGLLRMIVPEISHLLANNTWDATLTLINHLDGVMTVISPRRTDQTTAKFSMGMVAVALDHYRQQMQDIILHEYPDGRTHRSLLVLAALLPGSADTAEQRAVELRLSNAERSRLGRIVGSRGQYQLSGELTPLALHRFWYPLRDVGVDLCLLAIAEYLAGAGIELKQDEWIVYLDRMQTILGAYFEQHETIVEPPILLDGNALKTELDLKPGRIIGELLDHIREAQVTGDVSTVDEALAAARAYLDARG